MTANLVSGLKKWNHEGHEEHEVRTAERMEAARRS